MPRGNKIKGRSRAKHRQLQESQGLRDEQKTAEGEAASSPPGQENPLPVSDAESPSGSPESSPRCPDTGVPFRAPETGADVRGASVQPALSLASLSLKNPLRRRARMLLDFLLDKFQSNKQPLQSEMMKLVSRKYKGHFPEILKKSSEQLEVVYGLELRPNDSNSVSYSFHSKLPLPPVDSVTGKRELPKTGIVMTLLAVIFMNGNRATEQQVWDFLSALGIYPGRKHLIFGEPLQLLTKDLVEQHYLVYRQVAGSDPPSYEFLWGPRAYAETTKMKVLEVLAKVNNTMPRSFPELYEEAMEDEANRSRSRVEARGYSAAKSRVPPKGKFGGSSQK